MNKWSERQNNGNHPIRTADRIPNKQTKKWENNIRNLWGNIKCANVCIAGIPEGKEREKGIENIIEEIMTEKFPIKEGKRYPGIGKTEGPK